MPVRSLNSSVLKWPRRETVEVALRQWAEAITTKNPTIAAVGYFGSYSRNQAGVGSDLDVIILLQSDRHELAQRPFHERTATFNFGSIPVPVDAIAYTPEEWALLETVSPRFYHTLTQETVWVWREIASQSSFEQD